MPDMWSIQQGFSHPIYVTSKGKRKPKVNDPIKAYASWHPHSVSLDCLGRGPV